MLRQTFMAALLGACLAALTPVAVAGQEHSDIRFRYDSQQIKLVPSAETPSNSQGVWTGEWDVNGFFKQNTSDPGFASEAVDGLGIGPNDVIAYDVLDDLLFWQNGTFTQPGAGVQIRIRNNLNADTLVTPDSGLKEGSVSPPESNYIGQASSSGDFHDHVRFGLEPLPDPEPQPPLGAYGLKLSLITSANGVADSAPFFLVFKFGLDDPDFSDAVDAFATLLADDLPGDFNMDGVVDAVDYAVWREGLGAEYSSEDYGLWRDNYGRTSSQSPAQTANTPEPTAILLAAAVMVIGTTNRRERQ